MAYEIGINTLQNCYSLLSNVELVVAVDLWHSNFCDEML